MYTEAAQQKWDDVTPESRDVTPESRCRDSAEQSAQHNVTPLFSYKRKDLNSPLLKIERSHVVH